MNHSDPSKNERASIDWDNLQNNNKKSLERRNLINQWKKYGLYWWDAHEKLSIELTIRETTLRPYLFQSPWMISSFSFLSDLYCPFFFWKFKHRKCLRKFTVELEEVEEMFWRRNKREKWKINKVCHWK